MFGKFQFRQTPVSYTHLDVYKRQGLATSNVVSGTNVCMDQVNGNNIQKWVLKKAENAPVANGRYVISNAKFSENVISINGQNATLGTYVGAKNQMFDKMCIRDRN